MKPFAKISVLVFAAAALFLSGCSRQPARPLPSDTSPMGPQGGMNNGGRLGGGMVNINPELTPRGSGPGFDANNQMRGVLQPVYFAFDRSSIDDPAERAKIQAAATYLKDHPEHRLLLEGHADWRGTAEYNLALGDRRAAGVKQYLGTLGVAADRTETLSKGSLEAAKGGDDAAMKQDRRVEFVIVPR